MADMDCLLHAIKNLTQTTQPLIYDIVLKLVNFRLLHAQHSGFVEIESS